MSKIYVGNFSRNTTDITLRKCFEEYGSILSAIVMRDRDTGRSRGLGFVIYDRPAAAEAAVAAMNGQELDEKTIRVTIAKSKPNDFDEC